jgi:hypothetical protein
MQGSGGQYRSMARGRKGKLEVMDPNRSQRAELTPGADWSALQLQSLHHLPGQAVHRSLSIIGSPSPQSKVFQPRKYPENKRHPPDRA